nr:unnamed protein product [Callosobruchus chinensis]
MLHLNVTNTFKVTSAQKVHKCSVHYKLNPSCCRSDTFWEELIEQYKKYDYKEEESINKTFLMTIPSKKLPCPDEYRPTPITVKQGPTSSSGLSAGQGKAVAELLLALAFSVFLMY